jgi:galactonate dehydratase
MAVLTGIEAALWDLRGKREGKPVYELLGGRHHDRLRAYATGGPSNYPKDRLAQKIDYYLSLGFRALKIGAGSYSPEAGWFMPQSSAEAADFEADKLSFVRACAGRELTIMLDAHMANSPGHTWDLQTALAVARAIEPFQLFFFEEPLPYDTPSAYSELRRATVTPIAGGEPLTGLAEWRVFAERDAFDIAQPDASYVGGLDEFLRVASLFHDRGHRIATHSWGAAGALMQNVHCGFAALNTCILEIPPDYAGLHRDLLAGSFRFENGYVLPPETPGLGVVLTGEIKQRYPFVPGSGEFNSVPGKILAG